jgi:hypothetical protein
VNRVYVPNNVASKVFTNTCPFTNALNVLEIVDDGRHTIAMWYHLLGIKIGPVYVARFV